MKDTDQSYIIAIGGSMGSGKTTLAAELTKRLHAPHHTAHHVDIDEVAGSYSPPLEGAAAYEHLFAHVHKDFYHEKGTIVISATFRDPSTRKDISTLSTRLDRRFMGIFLHVPIEVAKERAYTRSVADPAHLLRTSDVHAKIIDWHKTFARHPNDDLYKEPWHTFTEILSTRELIIRTLQRINKR